MTGAIATSQSCVTEEVISVIMPVHRSLSAIPGGRYRSLSKTVGHPLRAQQHRSLGRENAQTTNHETVTGRPIWSGLACPESILGGQKHKNAPQRGNAARGPRPRAGRARKVGNRQSELPTVGCLCSGDLVVQKGTGCSIFHIPRSYSSSHSSGIPGTIPTTLTHQDSGRQNPNSVRSRQPSR